MKTSSAKSKGRRLAQKVKTMLLEAHLTYCTLAKDTPLEDGDIVVTPSGVNGPDLQLSPRAKSVYPFKFECKNQERLNLYDAWEQAKLHKGSEYPILVVSKNRNPEPLVVMELKDFLRLV